MLQWKLSIYNARMSTMKNKFTLYILNNLKVRRKKTKKTDIIYNTKKITISQIGRKIAIEKLILKNF